MMAEDVRKAITPRTKLIIINSPHNPTGAVTPQKEMEEIGRICLERGIYLYSDEIYSYLNYTDSTLYSPSVLDKCKERIIVATGFSKTFAMTGWRLGVAIGPSELMKKIGLLIETTVSCVPTFTQRAAIAALENGLSDVLKMRDVYKERRDYLVERLNSIPGISCLYPQGAFYVFPNITEFNVDGISFSEDLLKNAHVGICPGDYFGEYGKGYVRLCYATSLDNIRIGMDRIEDYVRNNIGRRL